MQTCRVTIHSCRKCRVKKKDHKAEYHAHAHHEYTRLHKLRYGSCHGIVQRQCVDKAIQPAIQPVHRKTSLWFQFPIYTITAYNRTYKIISGYVTFHRQRSFSLPRASRHGEHTGSSGGGIEKEPAGGLLRSRGGLCYLELSCGSNVGDVFTLLRQFT